MIAVILIGGMGTRLRPLTCDTPKPLLPVLNKPFLTYQFDILKRHGVRDVVLCTSYQADAFRRAFGTGAKLGQRLRYVHEPRPLGTGGAIKNAEKLLRGFGPFLVLNGDVLNAFDLSRFLAYHRKRKALATIALTRAVTDPTAYGVVATDGGGRIKGFLEKPSWDEIASDTINAGAYLFEESVLDLMPAAANYSVERSLFPDLLARRAPFFGCETDGYWIDIGTIERYQQVHMDVLAGKTPFRPENVGRSVDGGHVVLGAGTRVGPLSRFSGNVCVGPRCVIGRAARLHDCVVLEGTRIGDGVTLSHCVVGADCRIGAQSSLTRKTALAGGSRVGPYSVL